ncbi:MULTISPECIES: ribonuclease R [unclassified Methylophaga]|jgi:ribonuclease R|uniref:ribonuclease R n=3 Tax=Methylophaga TaxID=40222 RepID=UPI000C93E932|nr:MULTISPECIES: ribonuclease R [unclassified Methylophaga]MAY16672.1 ribonuclease R [Methylophaga sp.]MBN46340.1 ribonuclease R [Methylophaga sp.]HAO25409.1 ribonuclease R [Methylophaga sp.]|tara:strand:+ start:71806 stop:73974 length:2169 start_codon:yes stop_codon:yes gene_type:complete
MTEQNITDPFEGREAEKYDNPIPSREFILELLKEHKAPLSRKHLSKLLDIKGEDQTEALRRRLRAMERDGQILRNRKNAYGIVSKMNLVRGRVMGHPEGFGFLIPDEGGEDLFLSEREMRVVLHGDRALARVSGTDRKGRKEGAIVEVVQRANQTVVGRLQADASLFYLIPHNRRISQDIMIPAHELMDAKDGQIVEAEITEHPNKHRSPLGKIVAVLGDHMAPGMEIDIALRSFELPHVWSPKALAQAESFGETIPQEAIKDRLDLRDLPLVTIDGSDARDFDDAVYAEKLDSGNWRLWVAIADVSYYVKPEDDLDQDAQERATSVYFPSQVIPMLPEALSNGLCSLNPEVDRLCMACEMIINQDGEIESYQFHQAVMNSKARLIYEQVASILQDSDTALREQFAHVLPGLETMYELFHIMLKARDKRGAIDFEMTETQFLFDENRKIASIEPRKRNDAHRLIEEFMIAANVAAAKYLLSSKLPVLYRVHEVPSIEKLSALREFLGELGLFLGGGDEPEPGHYASLLKTVSKRPDGHLLQTVMLRSMKQAVYSPDNVGHFGLGLEAYAHFTSPIRRYPDLLVHRAIKHAISRQKKAAWRYSEEAMVQLGEHCSMASRRADEATRDVADWLKCEYMRDRVGEVHEGVISGVTGFGLFVELSDIYIEGLVHVTALKNDYYQFDASGHRLMGERTRKSYRLGDSIRVKVVRVDLDEKKIDLDLA